jgi:hypothetical protein
VAEAEMLEEYRGGVNSFVHISLPDDIVVAIEEAKLVCNDCGRVYYNETIVSPDDGIYIEPFVPKDGHCYDCGSKDIKTPGISSHFEQ